MQRAEQHAQNHGSVNSDFGFQGDVVAIPDMVIEVTKGGTSFSSAIGKLMV